MKPLRARSECEGHVEITRGDNNGARIYKLLDTMMESEHTWTTLVEGNVGRMCQIPGLTETTMYSHDNVYILALSLP